MPVPKEKSISERIFVYHKIIENGLKSVNSSYMKYYITPVTQEVASSSLVNPALKSRHAKRVAGFFVFHLPRSAFTSISFHEYGTINSESLAVLPREAMAQAAGARISEP